MIRIPPERNHLRSERDLNPRYLLTGMPPFQDGALGHYATTPGGLPRRGDRWLRPLWLTEQPVTRCRTRGDFGPGARPKKMRGTDHVPTLVLPVGFFATRTLPDEGVKTAPESNGEHPP